MGVGSLGEVCDRSLVRQIYSVVSYRFASTYQVLNVLAVKGPHLPWGMPKHPFVFLFTLKDFSVRHTGNGVARPVLIFTHYFCIFVQDTDPRRGHQILFHTPPLLCCCFKCTLYWYLASTSSKRVTIFHVTN